MASYSLNKKTPSCSVELSLLESLEDYIFQRASELIGDLCDSSVRYNYSVNIEDSLGTESLESIRDFKQIYFPDDTNRISLDFASYGDNRLRIAIGFSNEMFGSKISVSYDGDSAREKVRGLLLRILEILGDYKTSNWIFHPPVPLWVFPMTLVVVIPFIPSPNFKPELFAIQISVFFTGLIYMIFGGILKRYMTFDTKKNQGIRKWYDWVLAGLLAFLLFGIILTYVRQKTLGF